jgi:hypothetical protein
MCLDLSNRLSFLSVILQLSAKAREGSAWRQPVADQLLTSCSQEKFSKASAKLQQLSGSLQTFK